MSHSPDQRLEAAIMELLHVRASGKTICPSEAVRYLAPDLSITELQQRMPAVRAAAQALVEQGEIEATQGGGVIDLTTASGPIRLRKR